MNILKPRDLEILRFIGKFGYCQERHVAKLCGLSDVQISRIIKRLSDGGYINKIKVLADVSAYLLLTRQSGQLLEIKPINKPSLNTLAHDTLLVDLYFYLQEKFNLDQAEITADKQIRKDLGIHEINDKLRIPDLLINDNISIELEISEKATAKLQEIINSYIINNDIHLVCYFLKSKSLLKKIHGLINGSNKFKFFLFDFDEANKVIMSIEEYSNEVFSSKCLDNALTIAKPPVKRFGNFVFN
jgi:DNA-binding MarR family transcriptional regulator